MMNIIRIFLATVSFLKTRMFNRLFFTKVIIIFLVGFISRFLVNSFFEVNVFVDFTNTTSLIYYFFFSGFVLFVHELISYFNFSLFPSLNSLPNISLKVFKLSEIREAFPALFNYNKDKITYGYYYMNVGTKAPSSKFSLQDSNTFNKPSISSFNNNEHPLRHKQGVPDAGDGGLRRRFRQDTSATATAPPNNLPTRSGRTPRVRYNSLYPQEVKSYLPPQHIQQPQQPQQHYSAKPVITKTPVQEFQAKSSGDFPHTKQTPKTPNRFDYPKFNSDFTKHTPTNTSHHPLELQKVGLRNQLRRKLV